MPAKYNCKLTPEISETLCKAIEKGHSIEGACGVAEITKPTFYNWIKRGNEAKSGKYKQFVCDVELAKAKATQKVEKVILNNIPENPQDAKWWLNKHRPDTYGDRTFNETKLQADVKTDVTVNLLDKVKQKRKELNDISSNKE